MILMSAINESPDGTPGMVRWAAFRFVARIETHPYAGTEATASSYNSDVLRNVESSDR
jgi:hypothetical protein